MTEERSEDGIYVDHYRSNPGCTRFGGLGYFVSKIDAPERWRWEHYPYKEAPG